MALDMEREISFATCYFYGDREIDTIYLPITASEVSSPMGLVSNFKLDKVNMFGVDCL